MAKSLQLIHLTESLFIKPNHLDESSFIHKLEENERFITEIRSYIYPLY